MSGFIEFGTGLSLLLLADQLPLLTTPMNLEDALIMRRPPYLLIPSNQAADQSQNICVDELAVFGSHAAHMITELGRRVVIADLALEYSVEPD